MHISITYHRAELGAHSYRVRGRGRPHNIVMAFLADQDILRPIPLTIVYYGIFGRTQRYSSVNNHMLCKEIEVARDSGFENVPQISWRPCQTNDHVAGTGGGLGKVLASEKSVEDDWAHYEK
jgi:hypothetical protein